MKKINPIAALLVFALLFLPGCGIIMGIFQAGFWTAVILVVAVIALLVWGISSYSKKSDSKDI